MEEENTTHYTSSRLEEPRFRSVRCGTGVLAKYSIISEGLGPRRSRRSGGHADFVLRKASAAWYAVEIRMVPDGNHVQASRHETMRRSLTLRAHEPIADFPTNDKYSVLVVALPQAYFRILLARQVLPYFCS